MRPRRGPLRARSAPPQRSRGREWRVGTPPQVSGRSGGLPAQQRSAIAAASRIGGRDLRLRPGPRRPAARHRRAAAQRLQRQHRVPHAPGAVLRTCPWLQGEAAEEYAAAPPPRTPAAPRAASPSPRGTIEKPNRAETVPNVVGSVSHLKDHVRAKKEGCVGQRSRSALHCVDNGPAFSSHCVRA